MTEISGTSVISNTNRDDMASGGVFPYAALVDKLQGYDYLDLFGDGRVCIITGHPEAADLEIALYLN